MLKCPWDRHWTQTSSQGNLCKVREFSYNSQTVAKRLNYNKITTKDAKHAQKDAKQLHKQVDDNKKKQSNLKGLQIDAKWLQKEQNNYKNM